MHEKLVTLVFSRSDQSAADMVGAALQTLDGLRIVQAEQLEPGVEPSELALTEAVTFVLIASPASVHDDYVLAKLGIAWALAAPVVAVKTRPDIRLPGIHAYRAVISLPLAKNPGVMNDLFDELAKVV